MAALEWVPKRAKTVLVAVHGSGGVKENNWGPMGHAEFHHLNHSAVETAVGKWLTKRRF